MHICSAPLKNSQTLKGARQDSSDMALEGKPSMITTCSRLFFAIFTFCCKGYCLIKVLRSHNFCFYPGAEILFVD